MKRLLVASVSMLALAGCGSSSSTVGANSAESTEITAVGNVVANEAAPLPTPTPVAANTSDASAMSNDTAAATAATSSDTDAMTEDSVQSTTDHPSEDADDTVKQD